MLTFVDRDTCRDKGWWCWPWLLPSPWPRPLTCEELPSAAVPPAPHADEKLEMDLADVVCRGEARLTTTLALGSEARASDRGVNGLCPSPPLPAPPPPPPPAVDLLPEESLLDAIAPAADRSWPVMCEMLSGARAGEGVAGWARNG